MAVTLSTNVKLVPIAKSTYLMNILATATGDATAGAVSVNLSLDQLRQGDKVTIIRTQAWQNAAANNTYQSNISSDDWEALNSENIDHIIQSIGNGDWTSGLYFVSRINTYADVLPLYLGQPEIVEPVVTFYFGTNTDTKIYRASMGLLVKRNPIT